MVIKFLSSCFDALMVESVEKRLSPDEALRREIGNIEAHLMNAETSAGQRAILELTDAFYREISRNLSNEAGSFEQIGRLIALRFGDEVSAIKVDEEAYRAYFRI